MSTRLTHIAAAYSEAKKLGTNEGLDSQLRDQLKRLVLPKRGANKKYRQLIKEISTQLARPERKMSSTRCPECGERFSLITVDGQQIDFCLNCNSFWFDAGELKHFTDLFSDVPGENLKSRVSRYRCPICGAAMKECVFISIANLLVDKCPSDHGVYLESGELNRALNLSDVI
jgi:Zn-finger nucleic acid-binding protein